MSNLYVGTKYITLGALENMIALIRKIETQLESKGISEAELLDARLAPDMFPLVKQIQIMSDNAKGLNSRLSGVENPSMADEEKTFEELIVRLENTHQFIAGIDDEKYADADTRQIVMPYFPGKYQTAEDYVTDFGIANFYFHFVTAYAILRMKGFDIGKTDFGGTLHLRDL
ncbi:MAG: DUF1993 family protein [Candidatus Gracilibacteria bacterium]